MAVEGDLQTILAALVNGRCYPALDLPQKPVAPYIVFQVIDGIPSTKLDGRMANENLRVQIDIYHSTYAGAKVLKGQVDTAMDASATISNVFLSWQELTEPETKLKRISMDFSIWT